MNTLSTRPTSVLIVVNGKAEARAESAVASAVADLKAAGCRAEVAVTAGVGDASRFAREAGERGIECVVALGGDGTLNGVIHGVLTLPPERRPSVALAPLGTANDFARGCQWPTLDPTEALRDACDYPVSAIDAGRLIVVLEDDNGDGQPDWEPPPVHETLQSPESAEFGNYSANVANRTFINLASAGLAAETTTNVDEETKDFLGRLAYLFNGLTYAATVTPWEAKVKGEGFEWNGSIYALFVGNNRTAGGGFNLCPEAVLDDGLLDVTIIPEMPFNELLGMTGTLLAGGTAQSHSAVESRQTSWLEVDVPTGLQVNLDGEPVRGTHFRFESLPRAVPFRLPPDAPLVGRAPRSN